MNSQNIPQVNTTLTSEQKPKTFIVNEPKNLAQNNKNLTELNFWEELPEPGQEVPGSLPEFSGLILLNASTAEKDGFLVYVGEKENCLLASQNREKAIIMGSFTTGYRMYLFFQQSIPNSPKFNPRSFARSIAIFRVYILAASLGWSSDELSVFLQTNFGVRWVECLSPEQVKEFIKYFYYICQTNSLTRPHNN
jgi:hypothetical protein